MGKTSSSQVAEDASVARGVAAYLAEDVIRAIVDYVAAPQKFANTTLETASQCLLDAIACAASAADDPNAMKLLGPFVPGTTTPLGARVIGTGQEIDPVKGAFDTSLLIRWLDFSDTTPVGGHPSDNIGAILAVADHMDRLSSANGQLGLHMEDVLTALVKAYEIQGCLAASNRFDQPGIGLDHVIVVEIASAAVSCALMGGTPDQIRDAVANAWLDGHSLNVYRHVPNATSRKGWAGANAASRGVAMAWKAMRGEKGSPYPLSASIWGFSDVFLKGKPVRLNQALGTFYADKVIFKLVPVQRNASTAVEAAIKLHEWFRDRAARVSAIHVETHDEAMRRIVKTGPLPNRAARDHCIQYAVAVALLKGQLTIEDYSDQVADNPEIDRLRDMISVTENAEYTRDHHDLSLASCANAITISTSDGETSPRVEVSYPIGDFTRRSEATPLLRQKYYQLTSRRWSSAKQEKVEKTLSSLDALKSLRVSEFINGVCDVE
jgi:2-methylcitrate dehydratase